ncbi:hypothetical protein [Methanothrix sp.]|uniref:hypothetical protein n=1 Tax=Methanothrix sp. TaxID=90426 RepID=UPI003BB5C229
MKEIKELEEINPQQRDGLIILTKNSLESLQILSHSDKSGGLLNEELRSILNRSEPFKRFVRSISSVSSIKNYIPDFIIKYYCMDFIEHLVKEDRIDDDEISRKIDSLLVDLKLRVDELNVIVPLENIKLNDVECFEIGNAVLLSPDKISQIFNNTTILKDISQGPIPPLHHEIQNRVCACIKVKYDSQEIYNKTLIKIEPIINALRIFACFNPYIICGSPNNAPKIKIGISGTANTAKSIMVSYKQGEYRGAIIKREIYPELILDKEFLERIRIDNEFEYINDILCKEYNSLSNFEKQILTAVRWIGLGIDENMGTDKIIKFAIALECLLLDKENKENNSKSKSLAKRCAYILGNNAKERQNKNKRVKYLYNLRSRIIHDGFNDVNEEEIYEFQNLAIECVFKLLEIKGKNLASKIMDVNDIIKLISQKESDALDQYLPDQPWL